MFRNGQSGFTLLEVLVASAILAVAVAALMGGLSGSLRNLSRAQEYERAVLLARSQMNRLLVEESLKPGHLKGRWDGDYRWEAEIGQWDPAGAAEKQQNETIPPVAIIRFTVFWKGAAGEKSATFETSRYEPRILLP